jgi:hypothetical protein
MLTREAFDRQRAAVRRVTQQDGRGLALFSVTLGVFQLVFLRWAETQMTRGPRLAIAGGAFLVYLAIVAILVWRMERRVRAERPVCPHCGARLAGMAERVAAATGKCDGCGGQVLAEDAERDPARGRT